MKGMLMKALEEFQGALRFHPGDGMATRAIKEIQARLN